MSGRGDFFQIDRRTWKRVCELGLNPAVAYLVIARGTGGDNVTSSWSVQAIEKYTGIGRGLAKRAIDALTAAGVVRLLQDGTRPRYALLPAHSIPSCDGFPPVGQKAKYDAEQAKAPDWIWLPNSLVTGAASEVPPVERVRRRQNVLTLRLLVDLYHVQSLADDGGLHWRHIRKCYKRTKITERGSWVIWAFDECETEAWHDRPVFSPFATGKRDATGRDTGSTAFWGAWSALNDAGLVECVPHLVEADSVDATIIHPCPIDVGTEIEQALGFGAMVAAQAMLGEAMRYAYEDKTFVLPVSADFPMVELVGIYRLRYRAKTSMTAAWIAKQEECATMAEAFSVLEGNAIAQRPLNTRAA